MSLATIDIDRPRPEHLAPAPTLTAAPALAPAPDARPRPAAPAPAPRSAPHIRAVPNNGTEARGFVLYVGIDEAKAAAAGTSLGGIVEALKHLTAEVAPEAQTYAAVALAPRGAGGRDVDVVRLALQDPSAVAAHRNQADQEEEITAGVVIDISRKRLVIEDEVVPLTYKEFELLQYLVLREGRTIERAELITALWNAHDTEVPNERTIDVHVRRLRSKLGRYEEIVRTVRGAGYRYDRHADVSVRHASAPSPDLF